MSELHQLTGPILSIGEMQTIGEKGFTKLEFIVQADADSKYPQPIKLDLVKDGCSLIKDFVVGDVVTVNYNLRGSEFKGKHYVSLQAWKLEKKEPF
jgi:hypothetical protein